MLAAGLALMTVGIGFNFKSKLETAKVEVVKAKVTPTVVAEKKIVVVDVEGEVLNPGIYRLEEDSRVEEGLIAAGGLAAKADRGWVEKNLNRAERVSDGMKIFIPKIGESLVVTSQDTGSKLVNINTAGVEELDRLPGIGPVTAGKIIDYRKSNGGFKEIVELKLVPGIGDKLYEGIKSLVER